MPRDSRIAIVGMAGRFPRARDLDEFWANLRGGVDGGRDLSEAEILASGVPAGRLADPRYVRRAPWLDGIEEFDAEFFGLSAREAEVMDPQHRLFLEIAWEALEDAGSVPGRTNGTIGVYAGSSISTYLLFHLARAVDPAGSTAGLLAMLGNDKDYLASRVAYALGLHGPAVNVQTACSTSLVAVHLACQSLLARECDVALAGGVTVRANQKAGYLGEEGSILSPDGRCRSYDAAAAGTVFGSGAGAVVLKRFDDARSGGDRIRAIILGSAVNNDGHRRAGFTAPGGEGQARVVSEALSVAGIEARSVSYVEGHGTATALGDPIEVAALVEAFSGSSSETGWCALGSVKSNVGHLEAAAGVAGLIKTVLCLERGELVPSIHFERPNPRIPFARTPFFVNTEAREWTSAGPRRAGVSSFGIGGTNAHVVLEEAPAPVARGADDPVPEESALCLSARSEEALDRMVERYVEFLGRAEVPFADVCRAAGERRATFARRLAVVARDSRQAIELLAARRGFEGEARGPLPIAFLFAGAHAPGASAWLSSARAAPSFREAVLRCDAILERQLGWGVGRLLEGTDPPAAEPVLAGAALFVRGYAQTELLASLGVRPAIVLGYALGGSLAACVAGALSLEEALERVVERNRRIGRGAARSLPLAGSESGFVGSPAGPARWMEPAGEPVRIAGLLEEAQALGGRILIEVGSDPILEDALRSRAGAFEAVIGLDEEPAPLPRLLARLHSLGCEIDWSGWLPDRPRRFVALPRYPFVRQRYWIDRPWAEREVEPGAHPLLSREVAAAVETRIYEARIGARQPWYLDGHRLRGAALLPGSGFLEMALASGGDVLEDVVFRQVLELPEEGTLRVQLLREPGGEFRILSQGEGGWTLHALGRVGPASPADEQVFPPPEEGPWQEGAAYYSRLEEAGWRYGSAFRSLESFRRVGGGVVARLSLSREVAAELDRYRVHPAVLDAGFQALGLLLEGSGAFPNGVPGMPVSIDRVVRGSAPLESPLWCVARFASGAGERRADLALVTSAGRAVLRVEGVRFRPVARAGAALDLAKTLERLIGEFGLDVYRRVLPELDRIAFGCALDALARAGGELVPGRPVPRVHVAPRHARLLERLWSILEEEEIVETRGGERFVRCAPPSIDWIAQAEALSRWYPALAGEVALLRRCGEHLAGVLSGEVDGLELLFPGSSRADGGAAGVYHSSPFSAAMNRLLAEAVARPEGSRTLRILEIGAGTGSATKAVIDALGSRAAEYWFTDVSPAFLPGAARLFEGTAIASRTALFDVEVDPATQSIPLASFDRVVAANVLHATRDLRETLSHVRELLAPGGELLLLEATTPSRAVDLVFGLTEGWWRFADTDLRPSHPLVSAGTWKDLLASCGFESPEAVAPGDPALPGQALILGRAGALGPTAAVPSRPAAPVPAHVPAQAGLREAIRAEVVRLLDVRKAAALEDARPLSELGLDSLLAVELRTRLGALVGRRLPATLLFNHPTVDSLVAHLSLETPSRPRQAPARGVDRQAVAVIGLGCRFPGAAGAAEYWDLLEGGRDAVGVVPADRWPIEEFFDPDPDRPGKMNSRFMSSIAGVDRFDAEFFGISPREAASMDPQQRLVLEVAWEALEHAGRSPARLAGTPTGVFLGVCTQDYGQLLAEAGSEGYDLYAATGGAQGVAAGRLSYVLGLQGPSLVVNTACSSSLVALHLACRSLQGGECRAALAGGVNLVLVPGGTVTLSRLRMLSPDGRCKAFDEGADGFVRGEGCGLVVLKMLEDALAEGDRVLAVIRGSAVNQDGRSSGLTAPNGLAQEAVISSALARAGVSPRQVGYVEAHGTGTSLGDPIEIHALASALGPDRTEPLVVGSAKTNLGHLEAAAGIAGLIKVVLSLVHGRIPPHLHFRRLNPHIEIGEFPLVIPGRAMAWEPIEGRRIAGVSAFGFSGTNAHVVVEEAPGEAALREEAPDRPVHVLAISARDEGALRELAERYGTLLEGTKEAFRDVAHTAGVGRNAFSRRLAVAAADCHEARELLGRAVEEGSADLEGRPKVAFVYTGQGAQYGGMGRELYEVEPVFREWIDRASRALERELDRPLREAMFGTAGEIDRTEYAQPGLFALEYALVELWRSWGVEAEIHLGHSVGEFVASAAAGEIGYEDALRLVAARGRLMQGLPEKGAMAALGAGEEAAESLIEELGDGVWLAAVNSATQTVVSGRADAVEAVLERARWRGIRGTRLAVSHAFHSGLLDPVLDELEALASRVEVKEPRAAVISNVTGREEKGRDGRYWRKHARGVVRFSSGVERLWELGAGVVVEIGPHPALSGLVAEKGRGLVVGSMNRGHGESRSAMTSLARVWAAGVEVDWEGVDRGRRRRKVELPTYPFQRRRYWVPSRAHPLLGSRCEVAGEQVVYQRSISAKDPPYLEDHRVHGVALMPAACFLTMALTAARGELSGSPALRDVALARALVLPEGAGRTVQTLIRTGEAPSFRIVSQEGAEWVTHAQGRIVPEAGGDPPLDSVPEVGDAEEIDVDRFLDWLEGAGIEYGPAFRGLERLWRRSGEAVARIRAPEGSLSDPGVLHPAILDLCLQTLGALSFGRQELATHLPLAVEEIRVERAASELMWSRARLRTDEEFVIGDLELLDDSGGRIARIHGLRLHPAPRSSVVAPAPGAWRDWVYGWSWQRAELPARGADVAAIVEDHLAKIEASRSLDRYRTVGPALDRAAGGFARQALARGNPAGAEQVRTLAGRRRLARLREMAESAAAGDPRAELAALAASHPECQAEIEMLGRCGSELSGVLEGRRDPLDLIFPPDREPGAGQDSPIATVLNDLVARAVESALPRSGPVRILEIGAGTGGTTRPVLARLDPDRTRYLFTDISSAFLSRARDQFPGCDFLEFRLLDIERDPAGQGYPSEAFDVVLAANVLHATRDLDRAVAHARQLVAPGGFLVLLEGNGRQGWIDLVFGLTEGWWRFAEGPARADYPMLERDEWLELLARHGFEACAIPRSSVEDERPGEEPLRRQVILVAHRPPRVPGGPWLVVGDGGGLGGALAGKLRALGETAVAVPVAIGDRASFAAIASIHPFAAVVHLGSLDGPPSIGSERDLWEALSYGCRSALELVQSLGGTRPRLWIVTRGAGEEDPAAAALWGLARVIASELPDLGARRIDLEPGEAAERSAEHILAELASTDDEDQVRYRAGERARLRLVRRRAAPHRPAELRAGATYLITGGFGGLGLAAARLLIERGARHLALVGRREPDPSKRQEVEAIRALGASVRCLVADLSFEREVVRLLAELAESMPPVRGVIHGAGTLDDGVLAGQDWSRFERVLGPKVIGAWALHRGLPELDFFVLHSSASVLVGATGQGNHVAASAFLDGLARHRRSLGLPAVSIAWGAWGEIGAAATRAMESRLAKDGMGMIDPREGLAALEACLGIGSEANVAVLPIVWPEFLRRAAASGAVPTVFADLVNEESRARRIPSPKPPRERASSAPAGDERPLAERVHDHAARVLGFESGRRLPPRQSLFEVGLDSLGAVELRNRLQRDLGSAVALPSTLLFDRPNLESLVTYLAGLLAPAAEAGVAGPAPARVRSDEPIAVIGLGCRFPGGAGSASDYWQLLCRGGDAISEGPPGRTDLARYRDEVPIRWAGFLDRVDLFDPQFFGISPREAVSMDPQQRLVLEVAWEALEHAGIAPADLGGTPTGVFVGLCNYDYSQLASAGGRIDAYAATGGAPSIVAGRLSYVLGLEGPSMVVDTACSSSLVTVHLACESLRRGECRTALAGGVNLILAPASTQVLAELRMLSPDGRCKAFDERADGFVRGEGCGVVVLKLLEDARAEGDRILAVIRGSAVNQDGRSSGLTAPSGPAQAAVISSALAQAGVSPRQVGYVEAHGTGTSLGDPIEIHALASAVGPERTEPLVVGSVKTNLGHLEAAAGIAGLIKVVLSLVHGRIPPHLHFERMNPHIEIGEFPLVIPDRAMAWEPIGGRRIAGVSSFGFSGTNAHVVLEEAPGEAARVEEEPDRPVHVLAISARDEGALRELAERFGTYLGGTREAFRDVAHTAALGRNAFSRRLAVAAADCREASELLGRAVEEGSADLEGRPKVAFVYTGQGAQYGGMGRELYEIEPVFRKWIDRAAKALDRPLRDVMFGTTGELDRTEWAQPGLFALEYALAELWRSWGVEPEIHLGHSVGEFVASAVAGEIGFEEALRLVAGRGRLMQGLAVKGAMAALGAGEEAAKSLIDESRGGVWLAAVNSATRTVVSGREDAVDALLERASARGIRGTRLAVSHAFHSGLLDPVLDELEALASKVKVEEPRGAVISNVTGREERGRDGRYWREHARGVVRFAAGVERLWELGAGVVVEIGPHPALSALVAKEGRGVVVASMKRGQAESRSLMKNLARAWTAGVEVDWAAVDRGRRRRKVELPTYPFQRRRFWVEPSAAPAPVRSGAGPAHPLLGWRVRSPLPELQFENRIGPASPSYLADHRVAGAAVLPAAAYLEMGLALARRLVGEGPLRISGLALHRPLRLEGPRTVQVVAALGEPRTYRVLSASDEDGEWTLLAEGSSGRLQVEAIPESLEEWRGRCETEVDVAALYTLFAERGLEYGPAFRSILEARRGEGLVLARLRLAEGLDDSGYVLHPALLDGAFQSFGACAPGVSEDRYLPAALETLDLLGAPAREMWCAAEIEILADRSLVGSLTLFDLEGRPLVRCRGLRLVPDRPLAGSFDAWVRRVEWRLVELSRKGRLDGRWLVLGDGEGLAERLAAELSARGGAVARGSNPSSAELAGRTGVISLLALPDALVLAQRMVRTEPVPRLWLVTQSAAAASAYDRPVDPAQAALWGFGATLALEHPELSCRRIDLGEDPIDVSLFADAVPSESRELALRGTQASRPILAARPETGTEGEKRTGGSSHPYRLVVRERGTLDGLAFVPLERRAPGPGEVEIRVRASGLNFRDVLGALGRYPGDPGPLGAECSGIVTAAGPGVVHVEVGQSVLAIARGSMASHATADARLVIAKPDALSYEQAAAIPVAFLTAALALREVGRVGPGCRVLVHAAAGGVGLAAVEIARAAGAEVFATAGSEEKRRFLDGLGVKRVFDSRSPGFAGELRGMDLVLNSLSGPFIPESFSALRPGGRFLEIGKAGIWSAEQAAAFRPDVSYHLVALDEEIAARPEFVRDLWLRLMEEFSKGRLALPRYQAWPIQRPVEPFRAMQQARHIGKIVLAHARFSPEASYLVTGGLGAVGLEVARWMVEEGAAHLALLGRSDPVPEALAALDDLRRRGARIQVLRGDVSRREDVASALARLERPLAGIVHAAGVLRDGAVLTQDAASFKEVLDPKAGAWHLHELTQHLALDFFVLFSSAGAVLGSPGQSGYTAANAWLDGLARHRRFLGLPALSVGWTAWSGTGMAARSGAAHPALQPSDMLHILGQLLTEREVHAVVAPPDRHEERTEPAAPRFLGALESTPPGLRLAFLAGAVRERAARILALAPSEVEPRRPLAELGLDSLMALELRSSIGNLIARPLPVSLLFDYPTVETMTAFLADLLGVERQEATDLGHEVERLSESELLREIDRELEGGGY